MVKKLRPEFRKMSTKIWDRGLFHSSVDSFAKLSLFILFQVNETCLITNPQSLVHNDSEN